VFVRAQRGADAPDSQLYIVSRARAGRRAYAGEHASLNRGTAFRPMAAGWCSRPRPGRRTPRCTSPTSTPMATTARHYLSTLDRRQRAVNIPGICQRPARWLAANWRPRDRLLQAYNSAAYLQKTGDNQESRRSGGKSGVGPDDETAQRSLGSVLLMTGHGDRIRGAFLRKLRDQAARGDGGRPAFARAFNDLGVLLVERARRGSRGPISRRPPS